MPIYEYACKQCGKEFETLVRSSTIPDCPSCHSVDLEKKLSVFATKGATGEAALPAACGGCSHAGACAH